MLARLTSKNQLTLPKAVITAFPGAKLFDVRAEAGRIILEPVQVSRAEAVRDKLLSQLGLGEEDVRDAVLWARDQKSSK